MTELARESWKKALSFLLVLVAAFMMAGCGNTQSLSFKTPAGEKLEVKLDTKDDYSMEYTSDSLIVHQAKKVMLTCVFLTKAQNAQLLDVGLFLHRLRVKEIPLRLREQEHVLMRLRAAVAH